MDDETATDHIVEIMPTATQSLVGNGYLRMYRALFMEICHLQFSHVNYDLASGFCAINCNCVVENLLRILLCKLTKIAQRQNFLGMFMYHLKRERTW